MSMFDNPPPVPNYTRKEIADQEGSRKLDTVAHTTLYFSPLVSKIHDSELTPIYTASNMVLNHAGRDAGYKGLVCTPLRSTEAHADRRNYLYALTWTQRSPSR